MPPTSPDHTAPERNAIEPSIGPLDPARDDEAAAMIAIATRPDLGTGGREAHRVVAAARADPETEIRAATVGGALVAVCALRIVGITAEISWLVVAPDHRRRGHGRACLADALARAGRRPLVVETDADGQPFYAAAGFKLVGKRRGPDGAIRLRLGWHAPRPTATGPISLASLRPSPPEGSAPPREATGEDAR